MHGVQKLGQLVEPLPALPRVAGTVCYHLSQLLDVICPPFFKRSLAFEAILWNCAQQQQHFHYSVFLEGELQPDKLKADLVHPLAELIHGRLVHLLFIKD